MIMSMNVKKIAPVAVLVLAWLVLGPVSRASAANPPTNADELVAQHLDSIAPAAARSAFKTRVAQGPVHFTILVGGAGAIDGKSVLVSDGKKLQFMMKLPNNDYRGEQFIFDGDKVKVAFSGAQQTRSALGNFVFVQDAVVREGLLGGVLSTAWPLLDINARKAKLSFDGVKKIDGQELYELRYHPHKNSDLDIRLYFDTQTCRHLETIYSYTVSPSFGAMSPSATGGGISQASPDGSGTPSATPGGSPETSTARQLPNRYRLQEKFSEFKTIDGITLPLHYDIQFSEELQNGRTTLREWDIKGLDVSNNVGIDPRNFDVK
jgi:hypothetical protein